MLKERLLNKDFYLDNMSMFLKNSFGMIDREETYRAVLNNVNDFADNLISRYDIFNILFKEDYFIRNKPAGIMVDDYKNSTEDVILDNIAAIFGINRSMNITYFGANYNGHYGADTSTEYTESIVLSNYELYIYIQVVITKLNFQGTMEEIMNLYYSNGNPDTDVKNLQIYYSWDDDNPLECNVWFCNTSIINDNDNYNSNIVKLFLSDKLLIESLGVQYIKHLTAVTFIAKFDDDPSEDDPPNPYRYIFDPDFDNDTQTGFSYAVFA